MELPAWNRPSSPDDATLDGPPSGSVRQPSDSSISSVSGRDPAAHAWVDEHAAELTTETATLLRTRLRVAATFLFVGMAIWLIRHTFLADFHAGRGIAFYGMHVLTTLTLGTIAFWLWRPREIAIARLRLAELVVFGMPAALFLGVQYAMTHDTPNHGYFDFAVGPWLVLLYTYALFIPNSFGRAAVVISLLAAAPLVMVLWMIASNPAIAQFTPADSLITLVVLLVLAAVGGVFGVTTIGSLRQEAFEARQLGQYRLKRLIGMGGMGEVHLAEHQLLKRPCVVKIIRADRAGDPRVLARFQREVRATAKLSHWNIVEIFDYGVSPHGTFYYVMEYLPGMNLGELVERFGPLPPARVIYLLRQACDALAEAHAAGLIHRDIKPGNVFVARRGTAYDVVKLLDFGLVKPLVDEGSVHLTTDGGITGSPLFMAPEQAMGDREPDARSDIYAIGAVGYYLLCGRPPFEGERPLKVLFAHVHEPVTPPSQHRPETPADLEQVILRCLAKVPEDRYPDAESLAAALAACQAAGAWSRDQAAHWWQEQVTVPLAADASTGAADRL